MYDSGEHTVREIADVIGVSRPTVRRGLAAQVDPAPAGR
jgi:predicted transcriptional regulator